MEHIVFASPVVWVVLSAVDVVDYSGEKFPFSVESTLGSGVDFGNSLACEISVGKPALEFIAVFVGSIEGEFFGYCFWVAVVVAPCREVVLFLAIFGKRRAFRPRNTLTTDEERTGTIVACRVCNICNAIVFALNIGFEPSPFLSVGISISYHR